MSDEHLQLLRRRFVETGSVEAEAGFLVECARIGVLSKEVLELAAWLGHPAAVRVAVELPPPADVATLLRGLRERWRPARHLRAALITARIAVKFSLPDPTDVEPLLRVLDFVDGRGLDDNGDALGWAGAESGAWNEATSLWMSIVDSPRRRGKPAWEACVHSTGAALWKKGDPLAGCVKAVEAAASVVPRDQLLQELRRVLLPPGLFLTA